MIVVLYICSCSAIFFLNEASISSLNVVLFLSNILRRSSWENYETIVDSSFVMEAMADVALESDNCLGDVISFCCR